MKTQLSLSFLLSILFITNGISQKTLSGISIDETYTVDGTKLVLNGAGIREKFFIDLYVGALYLKQKSTDTKKIIDSDEMTVMKITIVSDLITKQKMEETIKEGFKKSAGKNLSVYQSRIDVFVKAISEDIKKGVKYIIVYNSASHNTMLYKDGALKSTIQGLDFKKILFSIWLGSDPVDEDLKEDLLGK